MPADVKPSLSSSAGFTLVEVLMAMLIMTVGLLGLLQSVGVAFQQSLRDRLRDEAVLLAEERMHDWRRLSFDRVTASGVKSASASRMIAGNSCSFTVTREIEPMGSATLAKPTKRLAVGVSWTIKRQIYSHEIYTLKVRRDDEQ